MPFCDIPRAEHCMSVDVTVDVRITSGKYLAANGWLVGPWVAFCSRHCSEVEDESDILA